MPHAAAIAALLRVRAELSDCLASLVGQPLDSTTAAIREDVCLAQRQIETSLDRAASAVAQLPRNL
jgi:hypothetical protein